MSDENEHPDGHCPGPTKEVEQCYCLKYKIAKVKCDQCNAQLRRDLRKQQRATLQAIEDGTIDADEFSREEIEVESSLNSPETAQQVAALPPEMTQTQTVGNGRANKPKNPLRDYAVTRQIAREKNNALFAKVRHTRELKLDADMVYARAKMSVKHAEAHEEHFHFDARELIRNLREKVPSRIGGGGFDWLAFGKVATVCYNSTPTHVNFLSGPMAKIDNLQSIAVKKRRRFPRQDVVTSLEQVLEAEAMTDTETRNNKRNPVKILRKKLEEKCAEARRTNEAMKMNEDNSGGSQSNDEFFPDEIDMVPFLIDPNSFTQTVENLFNFSHLIKKGYAGIRTGQDGITYIRSIIPDDVEPAAVSEEDETQEAGGQPKTSPRQAVLSLSMKDWRALVKAYNMTEGSPPRRTYRRRTNEPTSRASQQPQASAPNASQRQMIGTADQPRDTAATTASGSVNPLSTISRVVTPSGSKENYGESEREQNYPPVVTQESGVEE